MPFSLSRRDRGTALSRCSLVFILSARPSVADPLSCSMLRNGKAANRSEILRKVDIINTTPSRVFFKIQQARRFFPKIQQGSKQKGPSRDSKAPPSTGSGKRRRNTGGTREGEGAQSSAESMSQVVHGVYCSSGGQLAGTPPPRG